MEAMVYLSKTVSNWMIQFKSFNWLGNDGL